MTHVVFTTKDRKPLIHDALEARLFPYFGGILRQLDGKLFVVNGTVDHIHMLFGLPPSISVAEAVRKIKGSSSRWVHETFADRSRFGWQRGYGAFAVSKSNVERVVRYIEKQKAHHQRQSLRTEFLQLLRRHGLEVDERFLWT